MQYRAEVDGLRALAVIPVVLFHSGIDLFSGGFVGVDIFFVISGYLITSIIMEDIRVGRFSIVNFYERRARRILPALFLVMLVSSVFAYLWMLPDELENFGQSVVATALFSNNILLFLTTGYWDLASEFKPLLHTWSLAVEEQYYIFFPLYLLFAWRFFRSSIVLQVAIFALLSLLLASWATGKYPQASFYLLPTRAWELLVGSLCAYYLKSGSTIDEKYFPYLSGLGALSILIPIFAYSEETHNPGFATLVPVLGAALIICFSRKQDIVPRVLSSRVAVIVGLISYSAYLWHFPIFSFARIYSVNEPGWLFGLMLTVLSFVIAYPCWRFVEQPFRNRALLGKSVIFGFSFVCTLGFAAWGYYLHKTHGLPGRMYSEDLVNDLDIYIGYNERVFDYKKDTFSSEGKLNLLVVGNSFARDFVNAVQETYSTESLEIVYRDDLPLCMKEWKSISNTENLLNAAHAIVFASSLLTGECVSKNIEISQVYGAQVYFVGTKQFGYNLNWVIRLNEAERINAFNPVLPEALDAEAKLSALIPEDNYISILSEIVRDGEVPITDSLGRLLSADRNHFTKFGARYVGSRVLTKGAFGKLMLENGVALVGGVDTN